MKVLHINTSQVGGAALCAMRISKALQEQGIDSRMLVADGEPTDNITIAAKDKDFWYSNPVKAKVKHLLNRMPWHWDKEKADIRLQEALNSVDKRPYVHHPFSNYKNMANHPLVEWADVIHLHWVSDFVDYPTFFKKVKKPIVWTLHDMNPSRGLMHFYSDYSILPPQLEQMESIFCKIKRSAIKKTSSMNVVAISQLMKEEIITSPVLHDLSCTLIHNGVDVKIFRPIDRQPGKNRFLFSSYDIWDKRKGLQRVIDAIEKVELPNKSLVIIGNNASGKTPNAYFPIKETGLITNQDELARIYSQVDYFINASYEEAFAQTPLEAMACGTPVISTPCSGAKDLICSINGVVCDGFEIANLVEGIKKIVKMRFDYNEIRKLILRNYDYSFIAKEYVELYNEMLERDEKIKRS